MKRLGGGLLDSDDADAYDLEAAGLRKALTILARAKDVNEAIRELESIDGPAKKIALAVLAGEAEPFYNAYHPKKRG